MRARKKSSTRGANCFVRAPSFAGQGQHRLAFSSRAGAEDGPSRAVRRQPFDGADAGRAAVSDLVFKEWRVDVTGHDQDHINACVAQFHAQRIAERPQGKFAGAVDAVQRRGQQAEDAADIDDLAPDAFGVHGLLLHVREHRLNAAHCAEEIHLHQGACIFGARVLDGGAHADAGVVDENVHASEPGESGVEEAGHVFLPRHVGPGNQHLVAPVRMFIHDSLQHLLTTCRKHHVGSHCSECQRRCAPDPAGGPGDDDRSVLKRIFHFLPDKP